MVHDIMVHGVPYLDDAAVRLREELDQFEDLFGEIQWVRMGQNRRFHRTNYAFVKYRDSSVQPQVVRHFNNMGIPHTNIWFEINPRPTKAHHLLQSVPPTPRVARQLAEVDRIRNELVTQRQQEQQPQAQLEQQLEQQQQQLEEQQQQLLELRQQLVESNRQNTVLQNQLSNSHNLVNDLLNTGQQTVRNRIDFVQPPSSPSPRARHNRDPLRAWRPFWQQQATQRVERQLGTPPITRAHGITGGPGPICLEQFENCDSIVETVCGHRACESCMYQNVRHGNRNCPLCRGSLGQVPYRLINDQ